TTDRLSFRDSANSMCSSKSATATSTRSFAALRMTRVRASSERRLHLLDLEGLDHVADLDVLEALDADAALEALAHLGDVVLEVAQGGDLPFEDHPVVAQQTHARGAG